MTDRVRFILLLLLGLIFITNWLLIQIHYRNHLSADYLFMGCCLMERKDVMFGKHFGSMYEGSMIGAGAVVFAVMGYVIAKQVPDRKVGSQVALNPKLLAAILGEKEVEIEKAIEFLCAPDPNSRTKENGGRRLVRIGQFDYQVVNGAKYRAIRNEEVRREKNRESQARFRERHALKKGTPLPGEIAAVREYDRTGDEAALG